MALEMREHCEKCQKSTPIDNADVYICSYECTWCGPCAEQMEHICPNCGGELLRRPRRERKS